MSAHENFQPTLGSLFAGIGGFDLGFERAGWETVWQVELDPSARAVLADRFPAARRHPDIRDFQPAPEDRVGCITAGFPCQDISSAGNNGRRDGISGARSGLFFEAMRIIGDLRPRWVVLENVEALRWIGGGGDFATVLGMLRDCGYVGLWRVLDAQHFGSPVRRRRVFVVAGHGCQPPLELLADAAPVEPLPSTVSACEEPRRADAWAGYTILADPSACRIPLGGQLLVAEEDGWGEMAERHRRSRRHGIRLGLDAYHITLRSGAGNAVHVGTAQWIAEKLIRA